jgi:hypothetical protein
MEIDYSETTGPVVRVGVMREPADCCQERTTSGGCSCVAPDESEEAMEAHAMEFLGTQTIDATEYTYGYVFTFEGAEL